MIYYIYVLLSKKDGKLYTGYTASLKNRLKEHVTGRVFSTKNRLPVELVYFEGCLTEEDARQRERTLKSGRGKTYLKKRLRRFFQCSGFGPTTGAP